MRFGVVFLNFRPRAVLWYTYNALNALKQLYCGLLYTENFKYFSLFIS